MFHLTNLLKRQTPQIKRLLLRPSFPSSLYKFHPYYTFCSATDPKSNKIFDSLKNISLLKDDPNLKVSDYERMLNDLRSSKNMSSLSKEEASMALRLLYKLATSSQRELDLQKSQKYYAEALALSEKANIADTIELGCINNSLGNVYLRQDDLDEAKKYLDKASQIFQKSQTNPEVKSQIVQNIYMSAMLYDRKEQYDKALELYEQALKLTNDLPKEDAAPSLVTIYDNIGYIYENKGNSQKAIESWRKGLDSSINNYGKDSMEAKMFYENLAWAYFDQSNLKEAIEHAEKALSISVKHHGAEGSGTASSLFLLGDIYSRQGDYKKALEQYEKASKVIENDPQKSADQRAHSYMTIARTYLAQDERKKASESFSKAVQALSGNTEDQNIRLAEYYYSWGDLLSDNILTVNEAKNALTKALDLLKKLGSKDKSRLIEIYSHLGEIEYHDDKFDEALKLFQECLDLVKDDPEKERALEEVHSFVGDIYLKRNNYKESAGHHKKAADICSAREPEHPDLDFHYRNLGEAYEKGGELEQARGVYQKALDFAEKRYGKTDETTQRNLGLVLDILGKLNKSKEAEELKKKYQ